MNTRIRLPNGKTIELNGQQQEALQLIIAWMQQKSELIFRLSGYAGTGKTTIVKEALNFFAEKYRWQRPVATTAPTHKAKKEISRATGIQGKTIQSLLGLAPNVEVLNFDINKPEFAVKNKPGLEYYSLIVLDEAYMLGNDLTDMMIEQSSRFGVKILFMGDAAQLPPVKEETSPVATLDLKYKYELTQVERQAGDNPLMLIYDKIRNNLKSKVDVFPHRTSLIKMDTELGNIDAGAQFLTELSKFGSKVVTAFNSQEFKNDGNHCKILCWTNERVSYWNTQIRKVLVQQYRKLFGEDDPHYHISEHLMVGELLMAYSTYDNGLINSTEYKLVSVEYDVETLEYGNPEENLTGDGRPFQVDVAVYRVLLQDIDNPLAEVRCAIIEPDTSNYLRFIKAFEWYLNEAKFKKRWTQYFGWKANYMLLSDIKAAGGRLICKKDLDYAYALTIHKSQGSTYDQVFMDELDVDKNINHVERNKLKYVALSRPRYKATIFTGKED